MTDSSQNDKKNICVFGGTGFIGKYLLNDLSKQNGIAVKVLTRHQQQTATLPKNIPIVVGDLMDLDSITRFLVPGSTVINLAYLKTGTAKENLRIIQNLANACIQTGIIKLIHCSTALVIGRVSDNVITEDTLCSPITEYEKTKFAAENLLLDELKGKCEVVILRPTSVFGAGGRSLLKLADEIMNEPRLVRTVKTSLFYKRKMNVVNVKNVAGAILFLAQSKENLDGHCFIISGDDTEQNNYHDISKMLMKYMGIHPVPVVKLPYQEHLLSLFLWLLGRTNTNPKRIYSSEKLAQLGFRRKILLQDGLKQFADWYLQTRQKDFNPSS